VLPDWQQQPLNEGILREPSPDKRQLVLWVPRPGEGGRCWQRLSSVPGPVMSPAPGMHAVAAVGVPLRQTSAGVLGRLLRPFRKANDAPVWLTPTGATTEQIGARQTDLLLVWGDASAGPLDESAIQAQWPASSRRERLGPNLFLLAGVQAPPSTAHPADKPAAAPAPPPGATTVHPRQQAQQMLEQARHSGDRRAAMMALLDLGAVLHRTGDPRSAVGHLEEALALARELSDRSVESDALGNLALALLGLGQPARALELIEGALVCARESGDRFQIKSALDAAGDSWSGMRQPARALEAYREALELARELGDRPNQAELLWRMAIQHAELNDRAAALASGEASIDIFRALGNPQVDSLGGHLRNYAAGSAEARLPAAGAGVVVGGWTGAPASGGPGPLRMAFAALKALGRFVGSGMKTLPAEARSERLAVCNACPHHTGVRCRLCGCFTAVKTWLPHERCPIEKWR
jgi:tetratricopeptide (TPR) repeat protein